MKNTLKTIAEVVRTAVTFSDLRPTKKATKKMNKYYAGTVRLNFEIPVIRKD
ncbi:hypothetical protein [Alicyclobacillus pomorum]|jgi:hypothetical protein|uniref:hypothetical protein n=1 Tax=Alicyclobacillus pomorum TaxID=204470 RepID=UPI0004019BBF|nr:hypothetical protein [Alicyclobacillus pomorum]